MIERAPLTPKEFEIAVGAFLGASHGYGHDTVAYLLRLTFRTIGIELLPATPRPDRPTPREVLAALMPLNEISATTVEAYLLALLSTLWSEKAGFGGKRPFGESDWQYTLYEALGNAGYIHYERDEDGYAAALDKELGDELISEAILALGVTLTRSPQ